MEGKRVSFRFPVDDQSSRFQFNPNPAATRYSKNIDLVGLQVGYEVGTRSVSTSFTMGLALNAVRNGEIGRAASASELLPAIDRDIEERAEKAGVVTARAMDKHVVHLGEREWVRIRFVSESTRLPAWIDYHSVWNASHTLVFHVRYGDKVRADPSAVAELEKAGEAVLESLRVR